MSLPGLNQARVAAFTRMDYWALNKGFHRNSYFTKFSKFLPFVAKLLLWQYISGGYGCDIKKKKKLGGK